MVKVFLQKDDDKVFHANTYVMGKIGGNCVLVDPGFQDKALLSYIQNHYEKVVAILLTHGHFDHMRGVQDILKFFSNQTIPVYLHPEDESILQDPRLNASIMTGENVKGSFITTPVHDGEELELKGMTIRVIHTPFHTKGCVCYLSLDDNALFTGDTLFKGSIGRTDLPVSTPETVAPSLQKLLALKDTLVVYPGHGPLTNLGAEKKTNPYLLALEKNN